MSAYHKYTILALPGQDPRTPEIRLTIADPSANSYHALAQTFVLSAADAVVLIEKIQAALGHAMVAWDAMQPRRTYVESERESQGEWGHADHGSG